MPLSEKDRVERQVLRYLNFHERSPVMLACDREGCRRFECFDAALLRRTLVDMHARNLFRILPAPVRASDARSPAGRAGEEGAVEGAAFRAGVSVMITSDGKRRFAELRDRTDRVRQDDWQKERETSESGAWKRPGPRPQ